MHLFVEFRKMKSFESMTKLYEISTNEDFKNSIMVKEQLMVAYNKTGKSKEALDLGLDMMKNGQASGDVYGAVGKAYYVMANNAKTRGGEKKYLQKSIEAYEKGFSKYMEFYPGINAAYKTIALANLEKSPKKANKLMQKAGHIAEVVYLCTLKEGANETKDYWCAATRLEAACISKITGNENSDKNIDNALKYLMKFDMEDWAWDSTINSLKGLNKNVQSDKINEVIEKLILKKDNVIEVSEKEKNSAGYDAKMNAIVNDSFSYRGLASNFEGSSSVGGNMRFGGQLPDHTISRKDVEYMDTILNTPVKQLFPENELSSALDAETLNNLRNGNLCLHDLQDTDMFIKAVDQIVRYHFGTENFAKTGLKLEENAEINNSIYDQTVASVINMTGKLGDRTVDSRTNISVLFALGMGDCRHHAQVKQILFDRWQNKKFNDVLHDMYESNQITDENLDKFNDIYNTQLRTIDVRITLPIQLGGANGDQMYNPVKENGKYVINQDQKSPLEEHTMTMLLKTDENGNLTNAKIADAFYHSTYDWADHELDINNDIKVDKEGHYRINAGHISSEKVAENVELPVKITPTAYAGKRDKVSTDETGMNTKLLGINYPINDIIEELQNRDKKAELLGKIRDYNKELTEEVQEEVVEKTISEEKEEVQEAAETEVKEIEKENKEKEQTNIKDEENEENETF